MAKISVVLTDEHIALIRSLYFQRLKSRELVLPDADSVKDDVLEEFSDLDKDVKARILVVVMKEIKKIKVQPMEDYYGFDSWNLYGGAYLFDDMARILGMYDKVIPESLEKPTGARFPEDIEKHFLELDEYIVNNFTNIEEILHQFCDKGLKAGKYTCLDRMHIWEYVGE